ncbi:MAG TPA: hypothetical protein VHV83_01195 [Armatimonadota bacterium]|nr:hypothetical protein [Armatimonadota bacterium]
MDAVDGIVLPTLRGAHFSSPIACVITNAPGKHYPGALAVSED